MQHIGCLGRGTADEEPLVNGAVNLLRRKVLVGREGRQLRGADTTWGVFNSNIGARVSELAHSL